VAADRPAAVPMLARGLYLLHARYGHLSFEQLMLPAESLARTGATASRAFADDLHVAAGPLFADPQSRAVFSHDGQPLAVGDRYTQPQLAATLARMRYDGVGDFYRGSLALRIAEGSRLAGGPLTVTELANALPRLTPAIQLADRRNGIAFLPPPADGGLAAAAAFNVLAQKPDALAAAGERAQEVAVAWRNSGGNPQALLSAQAPAATLPALPATTTFLTLDSAGNAVACSLSMDNLFGTGRMVPGTGFLLAASPRDVPLPLLTAAIAWGRRRNAFRAAVAASGQNAAALAVATAMNNALHSREPMPVPVPDPGRANVIACFGYVPGDKESCGFATDPRGTGYATGGK
jgi:gamma-glutamyltranspeptidase/glutathione hydrolase